MQAGGVGDTNAKQLVALSNSLASSVKNMKVAISSTMYSKQQIDTLVGAAVATVAKALGGAAGAGLSSVANMSAWEPTNPASNVGAEPKLETKKGLLNFVAGTGAHVTVNDKLVLTKDEVQAMISVAITEAFQKATDATKK